MIFPDIELEKKLWGKGFKYVVGIDEAGRGPLAGPVCAGAVAINEGSILSPLVRDSKKMSEKQREESYNFILANSLAFGVCMVDSRKIDEYGIQQAVKMAMKGALIEVESMLGKRAEYLIIDGTNIESIEGYSMEKIKGGDIYHYSISAASILAKVTRDRYMKRIALTYPQWGFEHHVGYGTRMHIYAIKKYGICPIHRRSFSPIKEMTN